ncbi:DUF6660 family protein [Sphingobacterium faecium]|uniref:DUF6660 family protein n=1 Tax=Sphingobacterium faecium TaxID=34087 RepID=UPI0011B23C4C|nr:DUF6660 family protein [Sphingobacterium faecium]
MKIFVYILSLYFIALTMVPCADHEQESSAVQTAEYKDIHHNEEEHVDYCSPFCICSCCSTVLNIEHNTMISFVTVLLHSKDEIAYESTFYSFDYSSIWHPPQLV